MGASSRSFRRFNSKRLLFFFSFLPRTQWYNLSQQKLSRSPIDLIAWPQSDRNRAPPRQSKFWVFANSEYTTSPAAHNKKKWKSEENHHKSPWHAVRAALRLWRTKSLRRLFGCCWVFLLHYNKNLKFCDYKSRWTGFQLFAVESNAHAYIDRSGGRAFSLFGHCLSNQQIIRKIKLTATTTKSTTNTQTRRARFRSTQTQ